MCRSVPFVLLGAIATLILGCGHPTSASHSSRYDLRVYGPLDVSEAAPQGGWRRVRISAQDHEKAVIVIAKFLSDFTTLPTVQARDVTIGGVNLRALYFDGGRRILPVLRGNDRFVDLYLFEDPEAFDRFLSAPPADELAGAIRIEGRPYPFYLDRWDLRAMGSWYALGTDGNKPGLSPEDDFEFFRKHDMSVNMAGHYSAIAQRCNREGLGYKINRWFDVSSYLYDFHPEDATASDPDLTSYYYYSIMYGEVPFAENRLEREQVAEMMSYLAQFTGNDHFESICLPHGETGPSYESFQGYRDRDESSRQDFIHYLRDLRGLSLSDLGQRWYENAARFHAWDEVRFPRERDFYGWKDGMSQSLEGTWRLREADRDTGEKEQVYQPAFDDTRWMAFHQPGSQYLATTRNGDRKGGWMRFSFTPDAALLQAAQAGTPVYLTVCPFNFAPYNDPSAAWLNGEKLGDMSMGHGQEWAQYDVSKLLQAGAANVLTVYAPDAHVGGPTFLTLNKAEPFPTRDAGLNSRLYDVREWVADCVARANLRYLEYVRGVDAVRPVKLMAFDTMIDDMMPYVQQEGAYPHCTGESAFFRPWFKRYGYLRGVPDSSEPSQSPGNLANTKNLFFCMTMEGMNAHDMFIHLHSITGNPEIKAWYEQNVEYYKLMGRFDLKKPDIAVSRSLRVDRVSPQGADTAYQNDPGRGDFQAAHDSWVYCSERDIEDHLVDGYKVIFDSNFHTLNPDDVDALEAWVKKGGTLVLNSRSGRNTFEESLSWPIEKITGCTETVRPQGGTVTFEDAPAILQSYAGRSFANQDKLYDWQNIHYFNDCVSLDPKVSGVDVVARYDDGKAAIVVRGLGKGRVVVLGTNFYRDSHDDHGYFAPSHDQTVFFQELFKDLGVAPVVESTENMLWSERFISNNGTTEMLIVGNKDDAAPLRNASAVWDLDFTPKRVFDPVTGADIPVKIDGTRVMLDGLTIPPHEMRYYAVERTDWDTAAAVRHWLDRQHDLWRAVPAGRPTPPLDPKWPARVIGELSVKSFESEAEARLALAPAFKTDNSWKSLPPGDWVSTGLPTGQGIWAAYRKTISIDPAWFDDLNGAQPAFNRFYADSTVEVEANGVTIFKNGKAEDPQKVLEALHSGENLLTFLAAANGDGNGGFSGDFVLLRIPGAKGETVDIGKGWTIYASETDSYQADFPATGRWLMARKSIWIPRQYRNDNVWIEVATKDPSHMTGVATNGRYRYESIAYGARYRIHPFLLNITPDVRFGQENEIDLGGSNWHNNFAIGDGDFQSVKLIFEPKENESK